LLKRIEEIKPKLVVCGHVHEGYGAYKLPCGTTIVNASVLDEKYRLVNAPIVVEIDDDGIRRVAFGALESDGASV
jgi:Icc-related predicted phosphoesterase